MSKLSEDIKESYKEEDKEGQAKDNGLDYYIIGDQPVISEFKDLYLKNNDIIGWIKVEGTNIDYPVMQTPEDEQFYLHRDFYKEYSFCGCIFADAEANIDRPSDNIITYGHHMIDKTMYSEIEYWDSEDYYKKHRFIEFDTLRATGTYEIIAAFRTAVYPDKYKGFVYYRFVNASDEGEFNDYVSECKKLTPYTVPVSAEFGDQLITLSTCAYHRVNGRFVLVAKKIKGEEIDYMKAPIEVIDN